MIVERNTGNEYVHLSGPEAKDSIGKTFESKSGGVYMVYSSNGYVRAMCISSTANSISVGMTSNVNDFELRPINLKLVEE